MMTHPVKHNLLYALSEKGALASLHRGSILIPYGTLYGRWDKRESFQIEPFRPSKEPLN